MAEHIYRTVCNKCGQVKPEYIPHLDIYVNKCMCVDHEDANKKDKPKL